MNEMVAWNDTIACAPGEPQALERKLVGGIASSGHRNGLMPFKVLHGNKDIPSGATVYIPSGLVLNQKWSTEVFKLDEVQMVFVPVSNIKLVKTNPSYSTSNWTSTEG